MNHRRTIVLSCLVLLGASIAPKTLFLSLATAQQEPPVDATPEPPAPPETAPEPEPPPQPIAPPQKVSTPPPDQPQQTEESSAAWYDSLHLLAFADAYARVGWNFPKPQTATGPNRGYDFSNGFSFSWVGLDVAYDPGPVGGTIQLRFGPSVPRLLGGDSQAFSFDNVKQAFLSWRPVDKLQFDFGQFDTIYGIEVADSQYNMNYTRGTLYFVGQPFYHAGLRAKYTFSDMFSLTGLVVNGWNNTLDNNIPKTFGLQLGYDLGDVVHAALGYIAGPEQADIDDTGAEIPGANERWRHFVDFLINVHVNPQLSLDLNVDVGTEDVGSEYNTWWGVMAAGRYAFIDEFAVALRGEYFDDRDAHLLGIDDLSIVTGTLTLDFQPSEHLIIRLDNRVDWASEDIYQQGVDDMSSTEISSVLGVVAMAGN